MFVPIVNTSISASWLILAIIVIRLVFKKMPKAVNCVLWGLVAIRLICPFSIESPLSLIPSAEVIPEEVLYMEGVQQHDPVEFNGIEVPEIQEAVGEVAGTTVSQVQTFDVYGTFVWIAGMAAMLLYALISYLRLRYRVIVSINERDNIWLCDQIDSPFILGMFRPRIYMPSGMAEEQAAYVIAHEQAHLHRHDHWWKPLGFLLLSVYWFNPLIWLAYILFSRDIELACDEKVIRSMGTVDKQAYSEALLVCSVNRKVSAACPVAFGEVGVKARVKSILNYQKPALWMVVTSVVICAVVAVCFLTNPEENDNIETNEESELNESKTEDVPLVPGENRRNIGKTIFKSFAMEPSEFICFLPEEYEIYMTADEYWEIVQNIDRSVGCIMPVFFIDNAYTELYAVNRDQLDINHLYYYEKSTENKWVLNYSSETINIEDNEVPTRTDGLEEYFDKARPKEMEYQIMPLEGQEQDLLTQEATLLSLREPDFQIIAATENVDYAYNSRELKNEIPYQYDTLVKDYLRLRSQNDADAYAMCYYKPEYEFVLDLMIAEGSVILNAELLQYEKINDNLYAFLARYELKHYCEEEYSYVATIDGKPYIIVNKRDIPDELKKGFDEEKFNYYLKDADTDITRILSNARQ